MDRKIMEIYELLYSDVITPYNLLDNIFLDNYTGVNFTKENGEIVCELKCIVDSVEECYYYYFEKTQLNRIVFINNEEPKILYSRDEELNKALDGYNALKNSKGSLVV